MARVVVPGYPHHVTQRGNRRQSTFFGNDDYRAYLELMAEWCSRCGVEVWAYCLLPNHTHLIAVPESEEGLRRAIGEAHRRYTRRINFRKKWRGHLWQGRFGSFVMDGPYLLNCARYVERNPVRAGLCGRPAQYPWSSAKAHLDGKDDILVRVKPLLDMLPDWSAHLAVEPDAETVQRFKRHEGTGRPLGTERFVKKLEALLDRVLHPCKPGRKPKKKR